ncbi:MAG: hydantoinase B/oxoprolinase family protein [Saprospiraceae bacterium]|nr:hydantoinase B/oxoprolinase family protein [Saprospiraceae bacterium]
MILFGDESHSYHETIGGGAGAGPGFEGRSAVHQHMTNTKITDPEEWGKSPVSSWIILAYWNNQEGKVNIVEEMGSQEKLLS